jgi:hypothetical protein
LPRRTPASDLAGACEWRDIVSARWRRDEHINVLEVRATLLGVRWALSSPLSFRRRLLVLSDSAVAVGAIGKGRSSSPFLLRRLRSLAAHLLAGGLQLACCWLPSGVNPADRPSRGYV